MNDKLDNLDYPAYLFIQITVIGSSIAYGVSDIVADSAHGLLVFILINFFNCLSVFFGYKILNGSSVSVSTRFALASHLLIVPLLFLDISASILIPDLSVSGFPVRTIAMGILGLIVLTTVCLSSSKESDEMNE